MTGIYKITSPTGKVYIGSSKDIKKRLKHYKSLDCKLQPKLYHSIKKHGWANHKVEVLAQCDQTEMFRLERYYGELYNSTGKNGLNLSLPGYDDVPVLYSRESFERRSRSQSGKGNNFYGKKHKPETIEKLREAQKNKSPETRLKMRMAQLGKRASQETREKMRVAQIGRKHPTETRIKMRENSNRIKIVLNTQNGVFHSGVGEAAECYGIYRGYLYQMLAGKKRNKTPLVFAA